MLTDHDGIDNQRKCKFSGCQSNRFDDRHIAQRTGLCGGWWDVVQHSAQLLYHELRRKALHTIDLLRVLHGEQSQHSFAVDSELMKGFEVSLDSRSTTGIRAGDRQCDGPHVLSRSE